ncbi:Rib/alpha-like domain-containing protein [Trueperella pyogenes]|uniref:Rib/alpha-like domain-containing protein n=1 Tax=Trueperella pyogenes TaxID=1661 RepID=UPI0031330984
MLSGEGSSLDTAINADALDPANAGKPGSITKWGERLGTHNTSKNGGARVTGYAVITNQSTNAALAGNNTPVPAGTKVYMQWIDTDGVVSPIYVAKTRDDVGPRKGAYAFALPKWIDINGKEHTFLPGIHFHPSVKVWIEPYTDPATGAMVAPLAQANHPQRFEKGPVYGAGSTYLDLQYADNVILHNYMFPPKNFAKPESEWVDSATRPTGKKTNSYSITGKVWLEADGHPLGTGPNSGNSGDAWAKDYRVVFSSLTAEGQQAAERINKMERDLRPAEYARVFKENPQYVAETVYGKVGADGSYRVTFKKDTYSHKYLYGYVVDPAGNIMPSYSSYISPQFAEPNSKALTVPQAIAAPLVNYWYNTHFAVVPYIAPKLDITNFDTSTNPGKPGETALIEVTGKISQGGSTIQWTDTAGEVIKKCENIFTLEQANACTFPIPQDAKNNEIYTASLVTAGNVIAADSFIVKVFDDEDGDGIDKPVDPDSNNDGKPDDPNAVPLNEQAITHGVKLVDSAGKLIEHANVNSEGGWVISDGDRNPADPELQIHYKDKDADISTLGLKLTDKNGKTVDANAEETDTVSAWRGAKGSPVVRNFGLAKFTAGTYSVSIEDKIDYWAVTKASQLRDGSELEITGKTANQFVTLGFDTDNDGIADVDESDAERYEPNPVDPKSTVQGTPVTTDAVTFDNVFTKEAEKIDPNAKDSPLAGTKFAPGKSEEAKLPKADQYEVNPDTGAVTVKGTAPVGEYVIPVKVTYPDKSEDTVLVKVNVVEPEKGDTDANKYEPKYETVYGNPGEMVTVPSPTFTGQDGKPATPKDVTYSLTPGKDAPKGAAVAKDGSIDVPIPGDAKRGSELLIPVRVTYADKSYDDITAKVIVRKDSDGDGVPDPLDPKNPQPGEDFCPGTPEGAKVDDKGCSVKPNFGETSVIVGHKDKPIDVIVVPIHNPGKAKITQCVAENLPAGLTIAYDEAKGGCVISGTPTKAGKTDHVKITASYEPVDKNEQHNPGGKIGTNTSATIEDTAEPSVPSDADKYQPEYKSVTGKPGETVTVASPTFTDQGGKAASPKDVTFGSPEGKSVSGATINSDGSIKVVISKGAKNGDVIDIPVRVTYADKTYDDVTAQVFVRTDTDGDGYPDPVDPKNPKPGDDKCPDTKPGEKVNEDGCSLNDLNDGSYKVTNAQVGKKAISEAPTFDNPKTVKVETNPAPKGTTFALGKGSPETASIDSVTGVVSFTPSVKDANKTVNIPVVITYPDKGGVENVVAAFQVGDTQAKTTDPRWNDTSGKPNDTIKVPNVGDTIPAGAKVKVGCAEGWTCTVGEDNNTIVVKVPGGATPGSTVKVNVTVTYGDGSVDQESFRVTVDAPPVPEAKTINPKWNDSSTTPGKPVDIPNTGDKVPGNATVTVTCPEGWTCKVGEDNNTITVTPPADAKPNTTGKVTVVVTYKDGSKDTEMVTVTVKANPNWDDTVTTPDKPVDIPNTGGDVPGGTKVGTDGPGKGTLKDDGTITVTPNKNAKPGDKIVVTVNDKDGNTIDTVTVRIEVMIEVAPPKFVNPSVDDPAQCQVKPYVTVTQTQGVTYVVTVNGVELTAGADGKYVYEYGQTVVVKAVAQEGYKLTGDTEWSQTAELAEHCKEADKPSPPNWDDTTTTPDKPVDIPNTGGKVPGGTTIETDGPGKGTLKDDGTITVTPNKNAKPGDKIVVTVKDKDGNTIDTVTVTLSDPVVSETPAPSKKSGALAYTGATVLGMLGLAGLLTGVGALMLRRRNR